MIYFVGVNSNQTPRTTNQREYPLDYPLDYPFADLYATLHIPPPYSVSLIRVNPELPLADDPELQKEGHELIPIMAYGTN